MGMSHDRRQRTELAMRENAERKIARSVAPENTRFIVLLTEKTG